MRTIYYIVLITVITTLLSTCKQPCPEIDHTGLIPVYISQDVEIRQSGVMKAVPVIDRYLVIDPDLALDQKIRFLLDELSASFFNDLRIDIIELEETGLFQTLKINLAESEDYSGFATGDPYESWYGFFQGSAGALNTRITLVETLLQRQYPGDWIDALVVFYQGEPFGVFDHIDMTGMIYRFE